MIERNFCLCFRCISLPVLLGKEGYMWFCYWNSCFTWIIWSLLEHQAWTLSVICSFPYLAIGTHFLCSKRVKTVMHTKIFKSLKCGVCFWEVERWRDKFLISPEQWSGLEPWSWNKFFTSKYFLPNEEKYEQHSWQGTAACSYLLLGKLMNLLLELNILFAFITCILCNQAFSLALNH